MTGRQLLPRDVHRYRWTSCYLALMATLTFLAVIFEWKW